MKTSYQTRPDTVLERIEREIRECIRAQGDPALSVFDRLGALLGELDWRAERSLWLSVKLDQENIQ